MFRKILSIALAALMLAGLCMAFGSCSKSGDAFKIGVILLHDEKSTYDLNFINGVKTAVEELKKDLPEGDREYFKADVIRDKAVKFLCDNAKAE